MTKTFKQFVAETSLQTWKKQVHKDHGNDVVMKKVKFSYGDTRTIAKHPTSDKTVGVYNHKPKSGTVFEPTGE